MRIHYTEAPAIQQKRFAITKYVLLFVLVCGVVFWLAHVSIVAKSKVFFARMSTSPEQIQLNIPLKFSNILEDADELSLQQGCSADHHRQSCLP